MRVVLSALIGAALFTACRSAPSWGAHYRPQGGGVSVAFIRTGHPERALPPAVPASEVRVLPLARAPAVFEEIGYLEVFQYWGNVSHEVSIPGRGLEYSIPASTDGFLRILRTEAARRGCNAVVLHDGCIRHVGGANHVAGFKFHLGPTIIDWVDLAHVGATCVRLPPGASVEGAARPTSSAGERGPDLHP